MLLDYNKLRKFSNLEVLAKQVVEGFITGLHKSPFHGFSVEFAEHRLYNTGESTKHIDWKLYGRTERLFTKRYEEETNLRCQLVLDTSSSMFYPEKKEYGNKLEFSVYCAAALIELLRKQRDAIGLSLFAEDLKEHLPAKLNQAHLQYLFARLEQLLSLKEEQKETTQLAANLHLIADAIPRRSLVLVFSDFFDSDKDELNEIFSALQHLKYSKHEVVIFHVTDRETELSFEFENRPYTFVDAETGAEVKLHPKAMKEKYLEAVSKRLEDLKLKSGQYGVDFVEADIQEGFDKVLTAYLAKRSVMKS